MRVPDAFDMQDAEESPEPEERVIQCKYCKSTDVRWRQQNGKWRLFSNEPGKLHHCRAYYDSKDTNATRNQRVVPAPRQG